MRISMLPAKTRFQLRCYPKLFAKPLYTLCTLRWHHRTTLVTPTTQACLSGQGLPLTSQQQPRIRTIPPQNPSIDQSKKQQEVSDEVEAAAKLKKLSSRLAAAERELKAVEARNAALAPYRISPPSRGIIGNSRYAKNLAKQITTAAEDLNRSPVLIFGEPGLCKTNLAAMIHEASKYKSAPIVCLDCDKLDEHASELLGRGSKRGILEWLPNEGTVILNNVHKAPTLLPLLEREVVAVATYAASVCSMDSMDELDFITDIECDDSGRPIIPSLFPRIIMTAETPVKELEAIATVIKVPPLRLRAEDIGDIAKHILQKLCKQRGLGFFNLTLAAVKKLEAGQYPNNVKELEGALERAVANVVKDIDRYNLQDFSMPRSLHESDFWFESQDKERLRLNLLNIVPGLRDFLRSEWWPTKINYEFTVYFFAALVGLLFFGPQDREHNLGLNAFWCYWWPLSFMIFPFLGRVWCSVCPFMIYGELVQKWRTSTGTQLLKWPKEQMEKYGGWFLFSSFAAILVWEEVWDLPHTAYLSSWLLVLITAGAVVGSFFYERRIWCRYLCPIGGMNGLFAKLSMTELRARPGVCAAECDTYACIKGTPDHAGCPQNAHSGQLTDNRLCTLCAACITNCPNESIELRLRLPGADLWDGSHVPSKPEVALMFMLLGAVYLHDLPVFLGDAGIATSAITDHKLPFIMASVGMLAAPGILAWGADKAWRSLAALLDPSSPDLSAGALATGSASMEPAAARAIAIMQASASSYSANEKNSAIKSPAKPFLDLAYGYLPLIWAGTLAYYLDNLLSEAGRILPVAASTFELDGVAEHLPNLVAHPAVVSALQGTALLGGAVLSLGMSRRIAKESWKSILPQSSIIVLFTGILWHTIVSN